MQKAALDESRDGLLFLMVAGARYETRANFADPWRVVVLVTERLSA